MPSCTICRQVMLKSIFSFATFSDNIYTMLNNVLHTQFISTKFIEMFKKEHPRPILKYLETKPFDTFKRPLATCGE